MLLKPAQLSWREGQPFAPDYDDLYFTDYTGDGGANEVRAFFLNPCRLLARADTQAWLTVGELGFGTGLNFAVLAQDLLRETSGRLHFVSVEAHPLAHADWQALAGARPHLEMAQALAEHPLPLLPGWHHRVFAGGRVKLSVYHGDALAGWQDWQERSRCGMDAWLLDGFAPDRNQRMWSSELFELLGQLSGPQTRLATFSAAGQVRRALEHAGFHVHKASRAPFKREALVAEISGTRPPLSLPRQVAVAGAGIGGCSVARHLADLGVAVRLYDPAGVAQAAQEEGASKIAQAVLHARLMGNTSADAQLRAHAFHYARHFVSAYAGFQATGAIQLQGPNMDHAKLARICQTYAADSEEQAWWIQSLSAEQLSERGLNATLGDALWFPGAGVVDIPAYCAELVDHAGIEFVQQECPQREAPLVSCTGAYLRRTHPWLELSQVYGQLDHYPLDAAAPRIPVVGNGYCVPDPTTGQLTLGATYEYKKWAPTDATRHNVDLNRPLVDVSQAQRLGATRGVRTISSDRNPVVGRLDHQQWVATGFASMGTTMAAYAAALVSAEMAGWAAPATQAIQQQLAPQRFQARQARRGPRQGALQEIP